MQRCSYPLHGSVISLKEGTVMTNTILNSLNLTAGLIIGGLIGKLFGSMQNVALGQNNRLQKTVWVVISGSLMRITILLLMLVFIQILFPFLFDGITRWLVSVGVIFGYGWSLLKRLNARNAGEM